MNEDFLREEYNGICGLSVKYLGLSFKDNSFKECLCTNIKNKFDDSEWTEMLITESVKLTGFSSENFVEIFENREMLNEWRIGELVAEFILENRFNVRFYYNSSRDAKNLRANLTGADLIGFCDIDNEVCFLFGEVKTSCDLDSPPNVLYGKSGMVRQLESLKESKNKRHDLVKWIASKALVIKGKFQEEYKNAMCTYIRSDSNKVYLVGVLVRDTDPNEKDVKSRANALNKNVPNKMKLLLLSLYTGLKMSDKNWEKAMNWGAKSEN